MTLARTLFSELNDSGGGAAAGRKEGLKEGAEAHQPTFTFSAKQRPAGVRQVSWLSGHRRRPGLPRATGWPYRQTPLADHSGGTARDSHPLPYSLRASGAPDASGDAMRHHRKGTVSVSRFEGQAEVELGRALACPKPGSGSLLWLHGECRRPLAGIGEIQPA
jgi:hypothetical protein